jgi:hypothetical protein
MRIFSKQVYNITFVGSEKSKMFSKIKKPKLLSGKIYYSDLSKKRIVKSKLKLIYGLFTVYSSDIKN